MAPGDGRSAWLWDCAAAATIDGPPSWRSTCAEAAARFTKSARAAALLASELRMKGPTVVRLQLALSEKLEAALLDTPDHDPNQADSDGEPIDHRGHYHPCIGLFAHRLGLRFDDLLPPLRGPAASPVQSQATKEMTPLELKRWLTTIKTAARGLRRHFEVDSWSTEPSAFSALEERLGSMATAYRAAAGPLRTKGRPRKQRSMLDTARVHGLKTYELAKLLALIGVPPVHDDVSPVHDGEPPRTFHPTPFDTVDANDSSYRYRTEADFATAFRAWVSEKARQHYDLLRARAG